MKKTALILTFCFLTGLVIAQDSREYKFTGTVTDRTDEKPIVDFIVDVFEGNDIIRTVSSEKKGRFSMELPGGGTYLLEISKEGYYPKRAMIITNVPADIKKLSEFKFEMELIPNSEFEDLENVDPFATSIFDFPYVIFEYDIKISDLNYRKSYTDHIKDQYQAVEDLR